MSKTNLSVSMRLNYKQGNKSVMQIGYKQMPAETALKLIQDELNALEAANNEEQAKK